MLDILFENGQYPDFKEGKIKKANVGVENGKIAYIGPNSPEAKEKVDVKGKVVSPPEFATC